MRSYVLSLSLASLFAYGCSVYGPDLVAGGAGGGGGSGGSAVGGSGGASVDAGSDGEADAPTDAPLDVVDSGAADACVFDMSPTSCGCCVAFPSPHIVCPPGTEGAPDGGVVTLPPC